MTIHDSLHRRLAEAFQPVPGNVLWPAADTDILDGREEFQVVWLGPEFAAMTAPERQARIENLLRSHGQTRREFRNAVAFVIPVAAGEGSITYGRLVLPFPGVGYMSTLDLRAFPIVGGKITSDSLATEIQALAAQVLQELSSHLADRLSPGELARQVGLGVADHAGCMRRCFPVKEIPRWFFSFPSMPKVRGLEVLDRAVRAGFGSGLFGLLESPGLVELDAIPENAGGRLSFGAEADRAFRFGRGQWLALHTPPTGGDVTS